MRKCKFCHKLISNLKHKNQEYCNDVCSVSHRYYIQSGFVPYMGICACGCGKVWISINDPFVEYIKGHKNKKPKDKKEECQLCNNRIDGRFILKQGNFTLKVCSECYVKIVDLKLVGN